MRVLGERSRNIFRISQLASESLTVEFATVPLDVLDCSRPAQAACVLARRQRVAIAAGRLDTRRGAHRQNSPRARLIGLEILQSLHAAVEPSEAFFGVGHQYTHLDLRGFRVPVLSTEKGVGRGLQPLTTIMNIEHWSGQFCDSRSISACFDALLANLSDFRARCVVMLV